ncbi:MAG: polysaccharide deacetylase family protein [Rikenellaceae bacterium]|nr:polysaccharide deacetylase family protein [Rikenellaceae bacterium]
MHIPVPQILREITPDLVWHIPDPNGVFLTFDDGPTPAITEWILGQLAKYNAKATFFCIGKNAELYPELLDMIRAEGHAVGNHTHNHIKGWGRGAEEYMANITRADRILHTNLYRPPYGRFTPGQAVALSRAGYHIVLWNVLSRDYNTDIDGRTCFKNATNHIKAGSIVVFHDSVKTFKNMSYALPRTLDLIYERGLECKPIVL